MWKEILFLWMLCSPHLCIGNLCDDCICRNSDENPADLTVLCEKIGLTSVPAVSTWPRNIYTLDLSRNNISTMDVLERDDRIRIFKMPYCGLKSITPKAFSAYPSLKHLDISQNELKDLHEDTFFGLGNLTVLDMSNNNIKKLGDDIFSSLVKLEQLSLSGNPLRYLEARVFQRLDHLLQLDISNIKAHSLVDGIFHPMEKLRILNLSGNEFEEVPDKALKSALSLEALYFNDNKVVEIKDNSFKDLKRLKRLEINQMVSLRAVNARAFTPLTSLEELKMSFNSRLHHINPSAFDGIYNPADIATLRLRTVILRNNDLSTLDAHTLPWCEIPTLDLQGNPWHCDCYMQWIVNCSFQAEFSETLKCQGPQKQRNRYLTQLSQEEFVCLHLAAAGHYSESEVRTIAAVVGLVLALAISITIVLFVNRRRVKAWWAFRRRGQGAVYYVKAHTNPTDNGEL